MVSLVLAAALAATPAPSAVVKEGNGAVQKALKAKDVSSAKIANTVEGYVDFGELAKRSLGKEWDKLNKPQQADFTAAMKGVLRASYANKAIEQGKTEPAVKYGEEKVQGNEAVVATTITVKKDDFPVVYKLFRASEKAPWRVYDVVTDEVSLLETYRDQFRQLLAQKGFDGLLTTLKAKRELLERGAAERASGAETAAAN